MQKSFLLLFSILILFACSDENLRKPVLVKSSTEIIGQDTFKTMRCTYDRQNRLIKNEGTSYHYDISYGNFGVVNSYTEKFTAGANAMVSHKIFYENSHVKTITSKGSNMTTYSRMEFDFKDNKYTSKVMFGDDVPVEKYEYFYDELQRVVSISVVYYSAPVNNHNQTFEYDNEDNLIKRFINGRLETVYEYTETNNPFKQLSIVDLIDKRLPKPLNPHRYQGELFTQPKLLKSMTEYSGDEVVRTFEFDWTLNSLDLPISAKFKQYCPNQCGSFEGTLLVEYFNLP